MQKLPENEPFVIPANISLNIGDKITLKSGEKATSFENKKGFKNRVKIEEVKRSLKSPTSGKEK